MSDELATLLVSLPLPAHENPALVFLAQYTSPESRRAMDGSLRAILRALDVQLPVTLFAWHQLRYGHCVLIRTKLAERYGPASTNRHLSALRGVLKQAWLLNHISQADYAKAVAVPDVKADPNADVGRRLSRPEQAALFAAAAQSPGDQAYRDGAMLALTLFGGLRRSEAANLLVENYTPAHGRLHVYGKGGKTRHVFLPVEVRPHIDA